MSYIEREREWLLKRNLATILCFKSKLPEKFKCFIAVDGSMEIVECQKIQLKWQI